MDLSHRVVRPGLPGALALGAAAVAVLAAEASGRFPPLPWTFDLVVLIACLAGLLALAGGAWSSQGSPLRSTLALLLAGAMSLAASGIVRDARLAVLPIEAEPSAVADLDRRADLIQNEFRTLLKELAIPLEAFRGDLAAFPGSSSDAFELLDRIATATRFIHEGRGLSIYDSSGGALAWAGTSYPAEPGLVEGLEPGRLTYRAVAEAQLTRLYGLFSSGNAILVSEVTIDSRLAPHMRDLVLPVLRGDAAVNLRLQDFREEATGFDDHLARHGDRYTGGTSGERRFLFVALRSPDRTFLGYVRLRGLGRSDMAGSVRTEHLRAAAAIIALLFTALCVRILAPWRRPQESAGTSLAPTLTRLGAGILVLWSGRAVLSWFPLSLRVADADLFDASLFASAGLFNLLKSPGDLLLTSGAVLVTAVAANRICGRVAGARGRAGPGTLPAAGAIGFAILAFLCFWQGPPLAEDLIGNSSVNLLTVSLLSPSAPALVMQSSILAILVSFFLLVQGSIVLAGAAGGPLGRLARLSPRPGDGISRWIVASFLPCAVLAGLVYDPILVRPSRRAVESLFENVLMPEVAGQHEARVAMLRATMESLGSMPDLADRLINEEDRTGASMALDLWLDTPLATSGYNASLIVHDAQGRIVSRFARNLPPAFDSRAAENAEFESDEPGVERAAFLDISKSILHAHHDVMARGRFIGSVTAHILDEFDNVPFLTPESPYVRALAPQARRIVGLPSSTGGVRHTVYEPDATAVFSNQREVPPPARGYTDLLVSPGTTRWENTSEEGTPARTLFFSDGRHMFALGFALPSMLERSARSIRLVVLALVLLGAGILPVAALQARGHVRGMWSRLVVGLGRTHYRRLLTTFSAVTLMPLLALSFLMSGYVDREIDRDVEDRGRQGIQSAGSLVRTILETDEDTTLVDDTLYWLSLLVGEDVNFYEHGELAATSRRELFSSGLLSPRLSGTVYRSIVVDGKRIAMGRQTLREFEYRTITAPVIAGDSRRRGLLSLPLDAQAAEAVRQAREVGDAMLITFVAMIFLMGVVGYVLARRVSRPIRSLSAAAARITAGDLDATVEGRPGDETGELIASFNVMARAIKEQREDLERRKDYIEKILLNATIGVISMDRSGTVVTTNPAAGAMLGLPQLAPGSNLESLLRDKTGLEPLARALNDPANPPARDIELTLAGEPQEHTVRARAVAFLDGAGLILLLEDVTETVRSNRLAAWAEMARRIAHEIKNPLTPIQLSAEHIRRVHGEDDPEFPLVLEECLGTIMNEVAKLRQISGEFSTYARIPTPRREPTPMSGLIRSVTRPYSLAMPPGIALELDVPADLPTLEIDGSLLGRALVNLIENALQAMPRGGTLAVRARQGGDLLGIEIADTGVGMDAEARNRIFEPYFSTKDTGTGLGLAIARKAIEEHGGRIEVTSAPGSGTTMRVLLPSPRDESRTNREKSARLGRD